MTTLERFAKLLRSQGVWAFVRKHPSWTASREKFYKDNPDLNASDWALTHQCLVYVGQVRLSAIPYPPYERNPQGIELYPVDGPSVGDDWSRSFDTIDEAAECVESVEVTKCVTHNHAAPRPSGTLTRLSRRSDGMDDSIGAVIMCFVGVGLIALGIIADTLRKGCSPHD